MCFMAVIKAWGWRSPLLHYSDPSRPPESLDSQCTWELQLASGVLLTSVVTSKTQFPIRSVQDRGQAPAGPTRSKPEALYGPPLYLCLAKPN